MTYHFESYNTIDPTENQVTKALDKALDLLEDLTTIVYNLEGDDFQKAYEKLEEIIVLLKGE